ncbi:MAG: hypothetical protein IID36_11745 [Planctomycetes bacterium]|nr:hypothetical protein [Planctomycetota bacterium]
MADRPAGMYRCGRPVDPEFDPEELLFLRCREDHIDNGRLNPLAIRVQNQSVNRGKYSEPHWVLFPDFLTWRVASLRVGDIPEALSGPPPICVPYTFAVEHHPLDDNYAHSEIRARKNGIYKPRLNLTHSVKLEFRSRLVERARIIAHQ